LASILSADEVFGTYTPWDCTRRPGTQGAWFRRYLGLGLRFRAGGPQLWTSIGIQGGSDWSAIDAASLPQ
jgi:hypothetical protein